MRTRSAHLGKLLVFSANFSLAKTAVYVMPLVAAKFASPALYGGAEFALSLALLSCVFLAGAPLAGANQLYLVRNRADVFDVCWAVAAALIGISVVVSICLAFLSAGGAAVLSVLFLSGAVLQIVLSTIFKMTSRRNATAWADGSAVLVAMAAVAVASLVSSRPGPFTVVAIYGVYALCALAVSIILFRRNLGGDLARRLRTAFGIGLPMVLFSAVSIWLSVGGRLWMGFFLPEGLATYALAFRIAGFAQGIQQLMATAYFSRLYRSKARVADRLMAPFLAASLCFLILVVLLSPALVRWLDFRALEGQGREQDFFEILPVVAIQVFYWMATAMLQIRINRYRLSLRAVVPLALLSIAAPILIYVWTLFLPISLYGLCVGISLHAASYFLANWMVLLTRRLPHWRIGAVAGIGGVALLALALLRGSAII